VTDGVEHYDHRDVIGRRYLARCRPAGRGSHATPKKGKFDITAGDYVTYIEDQLGFGAPKADLRIIAESSFLQPNVLTILVKGGSPITQVSQLKGKVVSVNAPNDIGTLRLASQPRLIALPRRSYWRIADSVL